MTSGLRFDAVMLMPIASNWLPFALEVIFQPVLTTVTAARGEDRGG